jgi:hypothetical protein
MRWIGLWFGILVSTAAHAGGIVEVLERSQMVRLQQMQHAPEGERAERVRASFDRLVGVLRPPTTVELVVVTGPLHAEAMLGRLLVASEAVGDLPEGERLMLLAHELAHLTLGHWHAMGALYRQHIPGDVRPETTQPVAGALGLQAHRLSHRHEFEADAQAYGVLRRLGFGIEHAHALLLRRGVALDTATHPSTRRRLAQLRHLDARIDHPDLASGIPVDTLASTQAPRP